MADKTAGIILAAGGSNRLGRPKQLLDWFGKPFILKIIDTAKEAGLDPILVVTGAHHLEIEPIIDDRQIIIIRNKNWETGQSSSLIAGVNTLNKFNARQFVFLLCDQPQVTKELIEELIEKSQDKNIDIVTFSVKGKTCPPILFKKTCIEDIKQLKGDQGGKGLINKFNTLKIESGDERLILDCDSEEDYQDLIRLYKKYCA